MKSYNIVKKLEKEGYKVVYKKWGYWDGVPHVRLDGFDFAIAECTLVAGAYGVNMDFIYNHVLDATTVAENVNYYILRLIEAKPEKGYEYEPYLVLSMQDYYKYLKRQYPWDYWSHVEIKLKYEHKKLLYN